MPPIVVQKLRTGMGAIPHTSGVAFRVWAPNADAVYVIGSFNDWSPDSHPMIKEDGGCWYVDIAVAAIGDEYRYRIVNGDKQLSRLDPCARQVVNSIGNAVVHDPQFDWSGDDFHLPPINELVIYEMHLGTFHDTKEGGTNSFEETLQKLDYLKQLGVNVIEVM
ncbi:MAG: 1,4-alpha-glucan branching protein, partial [bacterium]